MKEIIRFNSSKYEDMKRANLKPVTRVYVTAESFRKMSAGSLFDLLPYLGKSVVAFEDIDMIGGNRNDMLSVNSSLLGDLLTNLDGMRTYTDPVVIMASTNKISALDEALGNRPGRFDRRIEIGLPSEANLKTIYKRFSGLDVTDEVLGLSKGFTGSHVVETINTARILAAHETKELGACMKEAVDIIRGNFFPMQTTAMIKLEAGRKLAGIVKTASGKLNVGDTVRFTGGVKNYQGADIPKGGVEGIVTEVVNDKVVKVRFAGYPVEMIDMDNLMKVKPELMAKKKANEEKVDMYKTLNDASVKYPELDMLKPGNTEIWYWKHFDGYMEDLVVGIGTLEDTHVLLGTISGTDLDKIYEQLQGEVWSPMGESNELIETKGLTHTSMSMQDVIKVGDKYYKVAMMGFDDLSEVSKEATRADEYGYDDEDFMIGDKVRFIKEDNSVDGEVAVPVGTIGIVQENTIANDESNSEEAVITVKIGAGFTEVPWMESVDYMELVDRKFGEDKPVSKKADTNITIENLVVQDSATVRFKELPEISTNQKLTVEKDEKVKPKDKVKPEPQVDVQPTDKGVKIEPMREEPIDQEDEQVITKETADTSSIEQQMEEAIAPFRSASVRKISSAQIDIHDIVLAYLKDLKQGK